jgi:hypothetical protein
MIVDAGILRADVDAAILRAADLRVSVTFGRCGVSLG